MCTGALIGAGLVAAGAGTAYAGSKAAGAQEEAAKKAQDVQERIYSQIREDLRPFVSSGEEGLTELQRRLEGWPGQWQMTPEYQQALQESIGAFERSQAARGLLRSGGTLREIADRTRQSLLLEQDRHLARKLSEISPFQALATMGASSAGMQGQLGQTAGTNLANLQLLQGTASANQAMAPWNALSGTMTQAALMSGFLSGGRTGAYGAGVKDKGTSSRTGFTGWV